MQLPLLNRSWHQKSYVIETDVSGIQNIKTRTVNFKTDENALMHVKYKELNSSNYISASEIYNNNFDNALLEGKIVLIGSSAQGIFDLVKTDWEKTVSNQVNQKKSFV